MVANVKGRFSSCAIILVKGARLAPHFFCVSLEALDVSEDIAVTVPVRCKRTTEAYIASTVFTPLDKSETTMVIVTHFTPHS